MTADAWVAIGNRHIWYRKVLNERLAQLRHERVNAAGLADRMKRHRARMYRHMLHGLALVETPDTRH
jgi:hypothetical protein